MIKVKIIKDSVSEKGNRITTWELEYPRFIHSEFMTHRLFSRNSASSRAIPLKTMINLVWNNPATPEHWGKNMSGMQAKEQLTGWKLDFSKFLWTTSGKFCCGVVWLMDKIGLHKQVANRILEPWSHIKVVMTATEMDNWFNLRNHPDAQPEIQKLASEMWDLYESSTPILLNVGEWHLPYVDGYNILDEDGVPFEEKDITLSEAIALSASLCAQVSYRKADQSISKAIKIYERLVESKPAHLSPFEHQATPIPTNSTIVKGETHYDYRCGQWSGNFKGWIQYRQIMYDDLGLKSMTCDLIESDK
jgi:hypothetical protein